MGKRTTRKASLKLSKGWTKLLTHLISIVISCLPVSRKLGVILTLLTIVFFIHYGPRTETIPPCDYVRSYAETTVPLNDDMLREYELLHEVSAFPDGVTPYTYKQ